MQFYWVTLETGKSGTVHAETPDIAKTTAETIVSALTSENQVAVSAERLPYPAHPIWFSGSDCPAFCYAPNKCKGNTSCPQRISCTE